MDKLHSPVALMTHTCRTLPRWLLYASHPFLLHSRTTTGAVVAVVAVKNWAASQERVKCGQFSTELIDFTKERPTNGSTTKYLIGVIYSTRMIIPY